MTTLGFARACPPFWLGFDVFEPAADAMLAQAVALGFRWCGRYLNNLTPRELGRIFDHGLGVLPYTEAMTSVPLRESTGRDYGIHVCRLATALGMPDGVHIAIDLESPAAGSDCAGHVEAMSEALLSQNFAAALYVGSPQPLNGAELYALMPDRYIKGGGRVAEPTCGWAALQLEPLEGLALAGVDVDVNVSKRDYQGRALTLWWPS